MANYSWPTDLPQEPFGPAPPTYTPADNTIRTSTGSGPNKLRRRFTATTEDVTISLILTEAQMATLFDLVKNQLSEVLPFDWVDHRTGESATYRFKAGYSSIKQTFYAGNLWTVAIDLELLP